MVGIVSTGDLSLCPPPISQCDRFCDIFWLGGFARVIFALIFVWPCKIYKFKLCRAQEANE